jgi:hypothetical protein
MTSVCTFPRALCTHPLPVSAGVFSIVSRLYCPNKYPISFLPAPAGTPCEDCRMRSAAFFAQHADACSLL